MKVKTSSVSIFANALVDSYSIQIMKMLADKLIGGYDLYERTGIPENIPIQKKQAARQIVNDMKEAHLIPHFISLLIDVHYNGVMGRTYPVNNVREIINEIQSYGYLYDTENRMFVENSDVRVSRNWGVLREGEEYIFSFIRLDIVGNTRLVKKYKNDIIQSTYNDLYEIVNTIIIKRIGRIWNWEGDGGLVAFHFSSRNLFAALCAMEIVHELFIYNNTRCRLDNPLEVRIAVDTGPCDYSENEEELKKNDTIKNIINIESNYTDPNTATISDTTATHLDSHLIGQFTPLKAGKSKYFRYELKWES